MKKQEAIKYMALTAVFVLAFNTAAFAYIDPGAGSNYLQKILAGIFGTAYSMKTFLRRLFSGGKSSNGDNK